MSFTRIVYNKGFSFTRIVYNKGFFIRIVYNNGFIQGLVIIRNFRNKHNLTRNSSFSKRINPFLYTILVVIGWAHEKAQTPTKAEALDSNQS